MTLHEEHFPGLIRKLYGVVTELESMFPGRPFTPDGHMVGSIAECYAEFYYGLELAACSTKGRDGTVANCSVEVKATQGNRVALRSGPERLLVFALARDGSLTEVYNGHGERVWELVAHKPRPSNGQYSVSLAKLRQLMLSVPGAERLPRVR